MAAGQVQIADVVVPAIFNPYVQQLTQEKSRIILSGAASVDPKLTENLQGEGSTFNVRSFKDLQNDAENISSDVAGTLATPNKIGSATEVQVRMSRNQTWASMDIVRDLIAPDPLQAIASRVSNYWTRRLQVAFVNVVKGVFADNDLAPTGNDTHTQYDLTFDISGAAFVNGVTNFTAESFIDATATMGDSLDEISMIMVHSIVYARMLKNDLIDVVRDSISGAPISYFQGRQVIVDDGMPYSGGVFESWLFGTNAFLLGMAQPAVPTEIYRLPTAGNGAGMETLLNRVEWAIHPAGYVYTPVYTTGGPSNATLALAATWSRIFPERKQIRLARLKTREF